MTMGDSVVSITEGVIQVVSDDTETVVSAETQSMVVVSVGEQGPPGRDGVMSQISTDPNNRITNGSDGGMFAPDILVDPLAYYILAKA